MQMRHDNRRRVETGRNLTATFGFRDNMTRHELTPSRLLILA
jgi:hypothetical protein